MRTLVRHSVRWLLNMLLNLYGTCLVSVGIRRLQVLLNAECMRTERLRIKNAYARIGCDLLIRTVELLMEFFGINTGGLRDFVCSLFESSEVAGWKSEVPERKSEVPETKSEVTGLRSEVPERKSEVTGLKSEAPEWKSEVTGWKWCEVSV